MKNILGITNELSLALQKKDKDIVNAMKLVKMSKLQLQKMRDDEWGYLLTKVSSFCNKHGVFIPNLDDIFVVPGRPRLKAQHITNLHTTVLNYFIQSSIYNFKSSTTVSQKLILNCFFVWLA